MPLPDPSLTLALVQTWCALLALAYPLFAEVVWGNPATISDYNRPPDKGASSPLVYKFDTGFGGLKYTISFGQLDQVRVTQVQVESQD